MHATCIGQGQPQRVRVLARFRSSGIFTVDPINHSMTVMVVLERLRLPPELESAFKHWVHVFGDLPDNPTSVHVRKLNEIGRTLARDLKAHLGAKSHVEYQMMTMMGVEGTIEPIR